MDKNPKQSYQIPRVNIPQKNYVPERMLNQSSIQELFLKIAEGDLFKIKDYILVNNMTLDVRDENNNSVIHNVIKNSNLTKNEKIEMVNFLIDRGAPVMTYNNENVTPLHLASKYQIEEIINILLEKGADPNVIDSQYMTPLHYAIQGYNTECKSMKKSKDEYLINNDETPELTIMQLNSAILDLTYYDENINRYLKHIKNTLTKYDDIYIYEDEYNKIKNEMNDDVLKVFSIKNLTEDQIKTNIIDVVYQKKKSFAKLLEKKLKETLKNINLKNNNEGGPSLSKENHVLPYKNIKSEKIDDYIKNIENATSTNTRKLINETHNIYNLIKTMKINARDNIITLEQLYWLNAGYSMNTRGSKNIRDEISEIIRVDWDVISNIEEMAIDNATSIVDYTLENNVTWRNHIDLLKINENTTNFQIERGSPVDIKKNIGKVYKKVYITQDNNTNNTTGTDPTNLGNEIDITTLNNYNINVQYVFLSKYKFCLLRIEKYFEIIVNNNKVLLEYMNNNQFYNAFRLISLNMTYLINSMIYLKILNDELNMIKDTYIELLELLKENGKKSDTYYFYMEHCIDRLTRDSEKYNKIDTEDIYNKFLFIVKLYNKCIDSINEKMFVNYITCYNNNFINNFDKIQTESFENIFTGPIFYYKIEDDEFGKFIKTLNNFNNLKTMDDIKKMKQYVISKNIPNLENCNFYFINKINDQSAQTISEISTLIYDFTVHPNKKIVLNIKKNISNKHLNIPNIRNCEDGFLFETSYIKINNRLTDNKSVTRGKIGIKSESTMDKKEAALQISGIDMDIHFYIIKYQIIEYVINMVYDILSKKYIPNNEYLIKLDNSLREYDTNIKKYVLLDSNNYGILLSSIGKIMDNIINKYLLESIDNAVLLSLNKILDYTSVQLDKTQIIQSINNINNESLNNIDYGFKLNLNEIIDEIIVKFMDPQLSTNQNKLDKSYQLNFTSLLLNEENDNKKNNVIHNYSLNSQKIIKQCYSINYDIIEKLAKISQINKKDAIGNTPLVYAIETHNIEAIIILLNNGANVNIDNVKNTIGMTPLEFARKMYQAHVKIMNNSNNFILSLTDQIFEKIKAIIRQNPSYKNNILKYSEIFFPQILVMINHSLFIETKKYPRDWTFEKMKKLSLMITGSENILLNPENPLLRYGENKIREIGIMGSDVLIDKKKEIEKKKIILLENINSTNKTNISLTEELHSLSYLSDATSKNRILELNIIIDTNNKNILEYNKKLNDLNKVSEIIDNNKKSIENNNTISNINNITSDPQSKIKNGNVINVYDSIFWNVLNNKNNVKKYNADIDFRSYPEILKRYIHSDKINNVLLLQPFLQKYVYDILFNHNITTNTANNIELISDVYENVLYNICIDYEELPLEYNNDNYVLKQTCNIIAHVLKHTLLTSLYHSITKTITKYIKTINIPNNNENTGSLKYDGTQYSEYINKLVESIINCGKNNESILIKYIYEILPTKLIKVILGIYDGENDPDKSVTKEKLYDNIVKIIMMNNIIPIPEDSSLIVNLKESLIPYFKDYIDLFINEAKIMVDGYYSYVISESRILRIISMLLIQSNKEKNRFN